MSALSSAEDDLTIKLIYSIELVVSLMQKQLAFVITAAVLMAAFASVALYTVHIVNAQNMTSAGGAKNMTGGASSNMTKTKNAPGV